MPPWYNHCILWSKPNVTLKALGIVLLGAYFARIFWRKGIETRNPSTCHICPSFAQFYEKRQMCSSTLTVSLLLVANLNFGFRKLYRVAVKPCQFCSNVTLFWHYSTATSLLHLAFNWSSRWCQLANFKISERIFMQLVESCLKNILSLPWCIVVLSVLSQGGELTESMLWRKIATG